jgi:hypothetical protein
MSPNVSVACGNWDDGRELAWNGVEQIARNNQGRSPTALFVPNDWIEVYLPDFAS